MAVCLLAAVFAAPAMATTRGRSPDGDGGGGVGPGPTSPSMVKAQLGWITTYTDVDGVTTTSRTWGAIPGLGTPPAIVDIIDAANQIAHNAYPDGGRDGHGCYGGRGCSASEKVVATEPFDCSGSVSWALHADGLKGGQMLGKESLDSGQFETWAAKGAGKWITIYANGGHAFMKIAGLYFDTAGPNDEDRLTYGGDRWSTSDSWENSRIKSYSVRHPKGW